MCFFCPFQADTAEILSIHLHQSPVCHKTYLKFYKVKSIEPVLASSFSCFWCQPAGTKLKISVHLRNSPTCKEKYFVKYKVSEVDKLLTIIEREKVKLRQSRSKASRKLEYEKGKLKKDEEESNKTAIDLLNQFRRETTFANVRHCFQCEGNFSDSRAMEVKMIPEGYTEQELMASRRFEKLFICTYCKEHGKTEKSKNTSFSMSIVRVEEGRKVFAPSTPNVLECGRISNNLEQPASIVSCLIPCTIEALEILDLGGAVASKTEDVRIIYNPKSKLTDVIPVIYGNEIAKFKSAKMYGDKYHGNVLDEENRVLKSAKMILNDFTIVGSEAWRRFENCNHKHRLEQHGSLCLSIKIKIPFSLDQIASCLIQEGRVISVEYKGKSTAEMETIYFVHQHGCEEDCSTNCQKERLEVYLHCNAVDVNEMEANNPATHVSSIQLKMNSMIRNFVKHKASQIVSEDYHFEVQFHLDGPSIVGYIWPKKMDALNKVFSGFPESKIDVDMIDEYVDFIDATISCSTDPTFLKNQFNLSESDSANVASLAKKVQYHYCDCGQQECVKCQSLQLPSLETGIITITDSACSTNISTSERLRKVMTRKLRSTNKTEIESLSTKEWLQKQFMHTSVSCDGKILKFYFHEDFMFIVDERLEKLIEQYGDKLVAVYQYSLTCRNISEMFGTVLSRVQMRDCYTRPFELNLLRGFGSEIEIVPINGHSVELDKFAFYCNSSFDDIDEMVSFSHREISLPEACSLFDKNIARTASSTSFEFVNAVKDRKIYFKKVKESSEISFKVNDAPGNFERIRSNIDKYFDRLDCKNVTLAEFVMYYTYLGQSESEEVYKLLSKEGVEIKSSEIQSAFSKNENLPEFILTRKREVMKIRNNRKLISYPCYEDNISKFAYAKVLLFLPLTEDIPNDDTMFSLYKRCEDPPVSGGQNGNITTVERIER